MSETPEHIVASEAELRTLIPPPSEKTPLKVLTTLDRHCKTFLGLARVAAVSTRRPDGLADVSLRGGAAGFTRVEGERLLSLPLTHGVGREAENAAANPFAGLLFLIPGIDETLRVNGAATVTGGGSALRIHVEEAFLHCPKAFVRSHLWDPAAWHKDPPGALGRLDTSARLEKLDSSCRALIGASPFVFLGTSLVHGRADVSPRGDPQGFVRILDERTLLLPDRPGNRLLDNWRNLLENPRAGMLFLAPGLPHTLRVLGRGELVRNEALLESMSVQGKRPVVALRLHVEEAILERSDLAEETKLWEATAQVERGALPTLGRMIIDQIEPAGSMKGVKATVLEAMLRRNVKTGLY